MESYFEWLRELPTSIWISESESLLAYPLILFLHSVGMALSAGSAFVIALRLLGLANMVRVSSLRVLFKVFWGAFFLNLVTGSLLFAAAATTIGYSEMYYAKLLLIAIGLALSVAIRTFVDGETSDDIIPGPVKTMAAASVVVWIGVITTGRLIAYIQF
jgi:hypothetical protein